VGLRVRWGSRRGWSVVSLFLCMGWGMYVRVEGAGAVEELEVEGYGCLAVNFAVWGGLHRHFRDGGVDTGLTEGNGLP